MEQLEFGGRPSLNLGAKYLDPAQLESNFPDYSALLERIEDQRKIAEFVYQSEVHHYLGQRQPQMYDNVFSILGGRGTGKSSVIQSLREKLRNSPHHDIIPPIITPELISERHCSILGWIMSMAEQVIDQIEYELQRQVDEGQVYWVNGKLSNDRMDFFKDCRFQKRNKLREAYDKLMRDCIQDSVPTSSFHFDEAVGLRVHLSQMQYRLIQKLNHFWEDVTTAWCLAFGKTDTQRPLIILMFDDVDLAPERSLELLSSTFQYFTNSNIILILTAAEKVLKQVIWIKMLERMAGSDYRSLFTDFYPKERLGEMWEESLSLESIDRMMREFYDKVVPPANRYYLRGYPTIAERRRYRYASMRQSFEPPRGDASIELDRFLMEQIGQLAESPDGKTFLSGQSDQIREAYLLIFGDKSRNIANGCLAVLNCVSRLKQVVREAGEGIPGRPFWNQVFDALQQLLRVLIASKSMLGDELRKQAVRLLNQAGENGLVRIDYEGLWALYVSQRKRLADTILRDYEQRSEEQGEEVRARLTAAMWNQEQEQVKQLQKKMAVLLVMLSFLDHIRLMVCQRFPELQEETLGGGRELAALLNGDCFSLSGWAKDELWPGFHLFPHQLEVDAFLERSPYVAEHIDHYVCVDPLDRLQGHEFLMDTFYYVGSMDGGSSPRTLLEEQLAGDQDWVDSVLAVLSLQCSGITHVEPSFLDFCRDSRTTLEEFQFGGQLNRAIKEKVFEFLKGDLSAQALQAILQAQERQLLKCSQENFGNYKIMESLRTQSGDAIGSLMAWYRENKGNNEDRFIGWYAGRQLFGKSTDISGEYGDHLINLVESSIDAVQKCLMKDCVVKLTKGNCADLLEQLDNVPNVTDAIRKARSSLRQTVERSLEAIERKEKNTPVPEGSEHEAPAPSQAAKAASEGETELVAFVPVMEVVNFMRALDHEIPGDDNETFWMMNLVKTYFKLSSLLVPYLDPEKKKTEVEIPDLPPSKRQPKHARVNSKITIPKDVWIVLSLNMVEYLMPAYLAARLLNQYKKAGSREQLYHFTGAEHHSQEAVVDEKLKALYEELRSGGEEDPLSRRLNEARDRVVAAYIERLERGTDE